MVAKASEEKSVYVSSFVHMSIHPPPTVELWSAVTNNRYWIAYVEGSKDIGWRLTNLYVTHSRRELYSILADTGREHDGDVAFLGCTWIGEQASCELTAEDCDGHDDFAGRILKIIGQNIHDAYVHTIKLYAQAEINPAIIPIRRMDK